MNGASAARQSLALPSCAKRGASIQPGAPSEITLRSDVQTLKDILGRCPRLRVNSAVGAENGKSFLLLRCRDDQGRLAWFPLVTEAERQRSRLAGVGILGEIELAMFQEPIDRSDVMPVKPNVPFILRKVT